jgi:predicted DNA-binding protein YlxM (UPF0122 family)
MSRKDKALIGDNVDLNNLATLVKPHYFAIFNLYFVHDLTLKQIGEIMGVSKTSVTCIINRCIRYSRYKIKDNSNDAWKKIYKKYYDNAKVNLIPYGFSSEAIDELFKVSLNQVDKEKQDYLIEEIKCYEKILDRLVKGGVNVFLNDINLQNSFNDLNLRLIKTSTIYFDRKLKHTINALKKL